MGQKETFVIRKAVLDDVKEIHKLINKYSEQGLMLYRPPVEIESKIRDYFICETGDEIIGCAALRVWNKKSAEVYALAVKAKHMGRGIGTKLIKKCISDAKKVHVPFVFTLTSKPAMFTKLGFQNLNVKELPKLVFTEKTINIEKAYGLNVL